MFKLSDFLITSDKLFHREGPTNEIAFCPMFVLRKGILSLANLFLVCILQWGANSKISFRNIYIYLFDMYIIYIYICIYMYIYVYLCIYYIYIYVYLHIYACMYVYIRRKLCILNQCCLDFESFWPSAELRKLAATSLVETKFLKHWLKKLSFY